MKKLAILAPALALIFACSGNTAGQNTSMQAGQWEMTPRITDVQLAGAPPGYTERAKQLLAREMPPLSRCMSTAEAANPADGIVSTGGRGFGVIRVGTGQGGPQGERRCNFTKRTFEGGRIDMASTCLTEVRQQQNTYTGTDTATTLDMQISMQEQAMGNQVRTTVAVTGRRTGDCAR